MRTPMLLVLTILGFLLFINPVAEASKSGSGSNSGSTGSTSAQAPGPTTVSSSASTSSGGGAVAAPPTPAPTNAPTTPVPNATVAETTQAPLEFKSKQTIEWYIVVVAIGIVFFLIGASCYVTLMWQQKALRDYKAKFEELLKERGMQKRKLEEEVKEREERWRLNPPEVQDDGLGPSTAAVQMNEGASPLRPPIRSSKYDVVSQEQRKKEEELAAQTARLMERRGLEREATSEARRGPMMVRRSGEAAVSVGGALSMDRDHNRRANDLLKQLKEKERRQETEERGGGSIEKGLSYTHGAHQNLQTLKSSSQLRNIASLSH